MSWNKPSGAPNPPPKKPSAMRGIVAGLVVAAIGAACVFFFLGRGDDPDAGKRSQKLPPSSQIPQKKTTRASNATVVTNTNGTVSMKVAPVERRPPLEQTREKIAPPEPLAEVIEKGRKNDRRFSTTTEALISMATPAAPGVGVPPIPMQKDVDYSEDMKKAFATPITADEKDDDESVSRKIAVLNAKDELQELATKEHWTLQEYVTALRNKHIADNDYLAECYNAIEKAYADPEITDESYIAMRDKINETLKERGLPEIHSYEEEAAAESELKNQDQENNKAKE